MIDKSVRTNILNLFSKKEEKLFVASLIDIVNKFETCNHILHTSFLNLNEKQIAVSVLNMLKVEYKMFSVLEDMQRFVIFFIPEYLENEDINSIYNEYIGVLKIIPNVKDKLMHKHYMGAIYSLGIKENMIGDIFIKDGSAYVFLFRSVIDYFYNNLLYISKVEVILKILDVFDKQINELQIEYKSIDIMVPSLRIDVILSVLYSLSRNEVKSKVENSDLMINSKEMFFIAYNVQENDIVSFRKCGKFKVGKVLRNTKNGKIVINVQKYV